VHSAKGRVHSIVVGLVGDLGSGKTTFVQGMAEGLGVKVRILSPTFVIMRNYQISNTKLQTNSKFPNSNVKNLYHVDLYRLEGDLRGEVENLGLRDIWSEPGNIVVIEWAEKIRGVLPKNTIWVDFEYVDGGRKIKIWQ